MKKLADILLPSGQHAELTAAVVQLIENQVAGRSGLRGMGLKTGLAMAKAVRPDILPRAVQRLLPEFAEALNPLYQDWGNSDIEGFGTFLRKHSESASAALLAVADARVRQAGSTVQSIYGRLRNSAENEVHAALPALSELLDRFLQGATPSLA
ncbi:hypothetical protein E4T66_09980 [Sinimarinibacterium sp. CAU 1509]|uniref:DUF6918 family protein n=1 Tax=Sinimarinibacterium sp. CAU 1509 TaxID=2562283 RepID=UPI0010ACD14F|nr:hypothetical protein [Sinimarinibacterium sp. CAU 1509]TJY60968.1 hypothetical protein E4T66_09980 [Sinimarinibacterium sp. CAU 1509]